MIKSADIEARLRQSTLVRGIDRVRQHLRCETAFLYPDGSSIDLFVCNDEPLLGRYVLSDLGQTTTWLMDMQVRAWQSKRRQALLEDALRVYDVQQAGGALQSPIASIADVEPSLIRLGQACIRMSDLFYTRKTGTPAHFCEEVEEFLVDADLEYEMDVEVKGRRGPPVKVDFLVRGRRPALVLALASSTTSQAHVASLEVFAKWTDIGKRKESRVTIFDDSVQVYRTTDLDRLREQSEVVGISETALLYQMLAA